MSEQNESASETASRLLRASDATHQRSRIKHTIVIVAAAIVLVVVSAVLVQTTRSSEETSYAVPEHATEDFGFRLTPAVATGTDVPEPGVTVALYEDFLCPSCRVFEEQSGQFLRDAAAAGRVVVEYRPFVFLLKATTNRYAQRAANAAACVADEAGVDAYAAMHSLLYANQPAEGGPGHEDETLIAWATQSGAPDAAECIRDETFAGWITAALSHGRDLGISKTPTVVVNDQVIEVVGDDGQVVAPSTEDLERTLAALGV